MRKAVIPPFLYQRFAYRYWSITTGLDKLKTLSSSKLFNHCNILLIENQNRKHIISPLNANTATTTTKKLPPKKGSNKRRSSAPQLTDRSQISDNDTKLSVTLVQGSIGNAGGLLPFWNEYTL